ncbi:MAG: phosphogluconate dehydratase [Mycobacterium sp.]|jgi:phosphogluconate dehydratase|nr:phosphogluconate dehydratase [Mycobacterium sp.]MDT5131872.1 phosphogluconate dehydratase [Mycobacterium sp.]
MTHPVIADVTDGIAPRSVDSRGAYLDRIAAAAGRGPVRGRLACANLAHGIAASESQDKRALTPR